MTKISLFRNVGFLKKYYEIIIVRVRSTFVVFVSHPDPLICMFGHSRLLTLTNKNDFTIVVQDKFKQIAIISVIFKDVS